MFVSQEEWGAIDETLDVLQDEQVPISTRGVLFLTALLEGIDETRLR